MQPNGLSFNFDFNPVLNIQKLNATLQQLKLSLGKFGNDIKLIDESKLNAAFKRIDEQAKSAGKSIGDELEEGISKGTDAGTKKAEVPLKQFQGKFASMGLNMKNIFSTALGVFGGGALLGGLAGTMQTLGNAVINIGKNGLQFQSSLADMSAITGVSGKALELFGAQAKALSNTFGGSAIDQITAYKGILSRLGPDIAKSPEALNKMTISVNTLAKAAGLDAGTSMDALTTAMLQFGVSLDDPVKAAGEMERMMNVMGAGAKEGAAEVPQITEALRGSGSMAKTANVSFEELNAGIQVLATRGKTGAEAGIALRNVMIKLAQGRFMPKQALEGLEKAGVDIQKLSDKTLPLKERLEQLKPIMKDDALVAELFGAENIVAGKALLENTNQLGKFTEKLTGTKTATEQAAINMNTMQEKLGRLGSQFRNIGLSIFQAITPILNGVVESVGWVVTNFGKLTPVLKPIGIAVGVVTGAFAIYKGTLLATTALSKTAAITTNALTGALNLKTIATNLTTKALNFMKAAWATNPFGVALIAITALVGGYMLLRDKMQVTALERKKELQDDLQSLKTKQGIVTKNKENAENNLKLIETYQQLAGKTNRTKEEQDLLFKTTAKLNTQYPETKLSLNGTASDFEKVKLMASKTKTSIEGYIDSLANMSKEALKLEKMIAGQSLNVEVSRVKDGLEKLTREINYFDWKQLGIALEGKFKKSKETYEKALQEYIDGFYNSKSTEELQAKADKFSAALVDAVNSAVLDKKATLEFQKNSAKAIAAWEKAQAAYKGIIKEGAGGGSGGGTGEDPDNDPIPPVPDGTKKDINDILNKIKEMYAIKIADFELTKKEKALSEGRKLNDAEELEILKYKHEANKLIAKDYLDQEKKLGDISNLNNVGLINFKPNIEDKDKENFYKNVEDVNKEIRLANIAVLEFTAKFNNDPKNKDEIKKLIAELEKTELEFKIKTGVAFDSDLTKLSIRQLKDEVARLNIDISKNTPGISPLFDEKTYWESHKKRYDIELQLNDLSKKLSDQLEEERIANIQDFALREREQSIANAKKTYEERKKQVKGSTREELQAFVELQNEKFKAEQQYMLRNSSGWSSNLMTITEAFRTSLQDLAFEFKDDQKKENLKKIDEEESAIAKSLNARTTAYEDYLDKITELDKKRNENIVNMNSVVWEQIKQITIKSLNDTVATARNQIAEISDFYTALVNSRINNEKRITQLKEENALIEDANNEYYKKNLAEIEDLETENDNNKLARLQTLNQAYAQTGLIIAGTFARVAIESGYMVKATVLSMLAGLRAMVMIVSTEILAKALATPASIASFGTAGFALWGLLTASVMASLSVAESAANRMKLWRGKVDIQGPGTTTSDSIPSDLSRRESVINARGTIPNIPELKWINQTGKNVFDYYISEEPERIKEAFYQIAEAKDLMKMGPVINLMIEERNREQVTELRNIRMENRILNRKIEKLTQVVEEGYYRRKETFEHNINLEFDDEVITTRADRRKLASLRRS